MAALLAPPAAFALEGPAAPAPAPAQPAVPASPAGAIRVGLGHGLSVVEVTAPGGLYVVAGGAVQLTLPPGQGARLLLDAGQIAVTGLTAKLGPGPVRLVPVPPAATGTAPPAQPAPGTVPPAPANPVTYKGKPYRGEIVVLVPPKGGLSVVSLVNLEEYLLGVVPSEMGAGWPAEALKAQAVAARSYAAQNIGKQAAYGYDVDDGTSDQVYGGLKVEDPRSSQSVIATAGQVVKYGANIASAMYHASSGGRTENNEIIYQSVAVPYLRGVEDFDNVPGNRYYSWQYTFTAEEFTQKLKNYGYDPGAVAGVSAGGTIGFSGRPSRWAVTGSVGQLSIPSQTFRMALSLPSSPRTVTVQQGGMAPASRTYAGDQPVAVIGADGVVTQRPALGTAVIGAGGATAASGDPLVATNGTTVSQAAAVTVVGGGYGHAVGMSQWGAYGMAVQNKSYVDILTHYYTGTRVETR
jgi:stage II sporulation protein D